MAQWQKRPSQGQADLPAEWAEWADPLAAWEWAALSEWEACGLVVLEATLK